MVAEILPESSDSTLAANLGRMLSDRKFTCAVAESCTGGMVGAAITSVAGASAWFKGGVIVYDNAVKVKLLGVPEQVLAEHGAVSAETVVAMATGVAQLLDVDCSIAVSGIAGPGGGTIEKPVGLVFIGIVVAGTTATFRHVFAGDREVVRQVAVSTALRHLAGQIHRADHAC